MGTVSAGREGDHVPALGFALPHQNILPNVSAVLLHRPVVLYYLLLNSHDSTYMSDIILVLVRIEDDDREAVVAGEGDVGEHAAHFESGVDAAGPCPNSTPRLSQLATQRAPGPSPE